MRLRYRLVLALSVVGLVVAAWRTTTDDGLVACLAAAFLVAFALFLDRAFGDR